MVTEAEIITYSQHLRRVLVFFFVMALLSLVGFLYAPEVISPSGLCTLANFVVWTLWCIDMHKRRRDVIGKLAGRESPLIRTDRIKDVS